MNDARTKRISVMYREPMNGSIERIDDEPGPKKAFEVRRNVWVNEQFSKTPGLRILTVKVRYVAVSFSVKLNELHLTTWGYVDFED